MKVVNKEYDKLDRLTVFETKDNNDIYITYISYYKNSRVMSEETVLINGDLARKIYYDEKGRIAMMKNFYIRNSYIIFAYDDNWSRYKPAFEFHYDENDEIEAEYHYDEEVAA